jgi:hypothetical protein
MCEGAAVVKKMLERDIVLKNVGKNYSGPRMLVRVTAIQFFGKSAGDTKILET